MRKFRDLIMLCVGLALGLVCLPRIRPAFAGGGGPIQITVPPTGYLLDVVASTFGTSYPISLSYTDGGGGVKTVQICVTTDGSFLVGSCGDGRQLIMGDPDAQATAAMLAQHHDDLLAKVALFSAKGFLPAP